MGSSVDVFWNDLIKFETLLSLINATEVKWVVRQKIPPQ